MEIKPDDLSGPEILALLTEHMQDMLATSPEESCHFLRPHQLRQPGVTFWSGWQDGQLTGCVALKELDAQHGEIKSMRTHKTFRRQGVAAQLLQHLLDEASQRGYMQLSLETGSADYFIAARKLYEQSGFAYGGPFADYVEDPNSVYMHKIL